MTSVRHRAAELMDAGMAHAGSALCSMLNVDVEPGVATTGDAPAASIDTAVRIGVHGEVEGAIVLLVPAPLALGELLAVPEDLVDSAIDEVANIVASHLVIGMQVRSGTSMSITPPARAPDPAVLAGWLHAGHDRAWATLRCRSPLIIVLTLDEA